VTAAAQADSTLVQPAWMPPWMEGLYTHLDAHPFLLALGIVVVGLFLAFAVRAALLAGGARITRHTHTDLDDQLMRLAARVIALVIGYLSVVAALELLPLPGSVTRIVVRALLSFMIVQLMRAGLNAVHIGLDALSRIQDRFALVEERTVPLFDLGLTILVVGVAGYALLQVWNINPAAWLASAGVVGIAVGFAARDTLANLFAGFFIIADAPYKVGDYVVLDSGERGEVTRVGVRSTRLLTRDDVEIIIPNSVMAGTKIINESGGPWVKFRIRLAVGVAYGSDVDQVVALLERIAQEHERVCTAPAPRVRMRGFGDSSLDFELLCWVDHPSERGLVSHELFMDVYKALNREGIEIPFPQRDLWVRGMPEPRSPDQGGETQVP
jgi:small-conductance mechanosensitive channel